MEPASSLSIDCFAFPHASPSTHMPVLPGQPPSRPGFRFPDFPQNVKEPGWPESSRRPERQPHPGTKSPGQPFVALPVCSFGLRRPLRSTTLILHLLYGLSTPWSRSVWKDASCGRVAQFPERAPLPAIVSAIVSTEQEVSTAVGAKEGSGRRKVARCGFGKIQPSAGVLV